MRKRALRRKAKGARNAAATHLARAVRMFKKEGRARAKLKKAGRG